MSRLSQWKNLLLLCPSSRVTVIFTKSLKLSAFLFTAFPENIHQYNSILSLIDVGVNLKIPTEDGIYCFLRQWTYITHSIIENKHTLKSSLLNVLNKYKLFYLINTKGGCGHGAKLLGTHTKPSACWIHREAQKY